uniref:(northern house mosquito) hypothetical protein n=1 Tax=Culex pipiens TaxID=7175 RepID=A0A8D8CLS9_CULPI
MPPFCLLFFLPWFCLSFFFPCPSAFNANASVSAYSTLAFTFFLAYVSGLISSSNSDSADSVSTTESWSESLTAAFCFCCCLFLLTFFVFLLALSLDDLALLVAAPAPVPIIFSRIASFSFCISSYDLPARGFIRKKYRPTSTSRVATNITMSTDRSIFALFALAATGGV